MTQMPAHERFENSALVEAWLKEPSFLEPVDEGRVAAIVHHTPQVRRWPPPVDLGRFAPMFDASKFVAASVILALTGSLLFNAMPTEPAAEESIVGSETPTTPTAEATAAVITQPPAKAEAAVPIITLPDVLPDGVESGAIQTPAGPARWVHLRADADDRSIPIWPDLVPWDDGLAAWNTYFGEVHSTTDGLEWERSQQPLAGPAGPMLVGRGVTATYLDGTYIVIDSRADRVWTSTDPTERWQELDASALSSERPRGWETEFRGVMSGPMVINGQIVFTIQDRYRIPRRELGISLDGTRNLQALPDGRFVLCAPGPRSDCSADGKWVLRFRETPEGLVVRHDKTGKRLGLIRGATKDELYEGQDRRLNRMFAIEGDSVVEMESAGAGLSPGQLNQRVTAGDGSALVLRYWQSDGRGSASTPGLPSVASEVSEGSTLTVQRVGDRLFAHASRKRSPVTQAAWVSRDGIEWSPAPEGAPKETRVEWVGSGWMATRQRLDAADSAERWLYLGGEWVSLESMGAEAQAPWTFAVGLGGVTILTNEQDGRNLWVLTHPLPQE